MSEGISLRREQALAWVTLDRPEVRNALSFHMLGRLGELVAQLHHADDVRVVLFTGAGNRAFCAGADLKERVDFTPEQTQAFVARIGRVFEAVAALPQPTIAVVNGAAYGGGLELALACDLRLAATTAKMGLTETSLAIIPGAGGTQRLPAVVGTARARELIFSARRVDGAEAEAMGLVNRAVEPGLLAAEAEALADAIAANGPLAVRAAKVALGLAAQGGDLSARLQAEQALYRDRVLSSADRLEALAAFREKRSPRYRGA